MTEMVSIRVQRAIPSPCDVHGTEAVARLRIDFTGHRYLYCNDCADRFIEILQDTRHAILKVRDD